MGHASHNALLMVLLVPYITTGLMGLCDLWGGGVGYRGMGMT